ncbi:FG-GAP-like repeat-containing protein [Gayadomonas joobiniege]|uniref:FG-GAP-like repeat-containing protein n=1 Tax=Gayadomonas joobiniege TaxID=1234606 RepID=UPI0003740C5A|nr:FG-GAP-like repeat-containing protein [Gayadomonas joobiniege]
MKLNKKYTNTTIAAAFIALLTGCSSQDTSQYEASIQLDVRSLKTVPVTVTGHLQKRLTFTVNNPGTYANLTLFADGKKIIDSLNIPESGTHTINALVKFSKQGTLDLKFLAQNADLTVIDFKMTDVTEIDLPSFKDISVAAGLDKVDSIKYGGPTIADFDNDGDYDFVVNNHNLESSKLYWNQGDGTVNKHHKNLSRWFMNDLHGTAAGDYDNDGDLDLVVTQGGGVGKNPSTANFYQNNNGELVLMTGDVGITKGGRGRGAKWSDMDLDGDLDLLLFNEASLYGDKPQHYFYENLGNAKFKLKSVPGIQNVHPSRAIVTDLNQDNIDDIILYSPLSVWLGNGDFTFTEITDRFPKQIAESKGVIAIADIDIDNDGDLDLYLTGGTTYGQDPDNAPMLDFDALNQKMSLRSEGKPGKEAFDFSGGEQITLTDYDHSARAIQRNKDYPIFIGQDKKRFDVKKGEDLIINAKHAKGWPQDTSQSGVYFGYLGNGEWRALLVRNKHLFWNYSFSLNGVSHVKPEFAPQNRNQADYLLRNDGEQFIDVSKQWNIPLGGKTNGVTVGDFNNDSYQDLMLYRWGNISSKVAELMLLNTGKGYFEITSAHGAVADGTKGHGDMGQAFDFNLDGQLDLLSGDESGQWYLYQNQTANKNAHTLVRVGYSPNENVDPISARVTVTTDEGIYTKRVGSAGAVFSQSLLNIVHFGLGEAKQIKSVVVRWRNGETMQFSQKAVNQLLDTDKADPAKMALRPKNFEIREGTERQLTAQFTPDNANNAVVWKSNNANVLTVDETGLVSAVGQVGEQATITARSLANNLVAKSIGTIKKWQAVSAERIRIENKLDKLYVGDSTQLTAQVTPDFADDNQVIWFSSQNKVAQMSANGQLTAIAPGRTVITAMTGTDKKVTDSFTVKVEAPVKASLKIIDADKYQNSELKTSDTLTVKVAFHAGSDNQVIKADQGGIKYWLRHFESEWIPVKDYTYIDSDLVGKTSGVSQMQIPLSQLKPSADLPKGHFYLLGVSFASSNGKIYKEQIYPLNIVK